MRLSLMRRYRFSQLYRLSSFESWLVKPSVAIFVNSSSCMGSSVTARVLVPHAPRRAVVWSSVLIANSRDVRIPIIQLRCDSLCRAPERWLALLISQRRILSPVRLPSSWYWKQVAATLNVPGFKPVTTLISFSDIAVALR